MQPIVVLVSPQLGENIGMTARAMLNCGLTRLRLVRPRCPWPSLVAKSSSAGADLVLDGATLHDSLADALGDTHRAYAMTARPRNMAKTVMTPRDAMPHIQDHITTGETIALVFGAESCGLTNEDISLCTTILTAPINPDFSSLNLSQAVLLVAYEWLLTSQAAPVPHTPLKKGTLPARKEEIYGFYDHLESELDRTRFLRVPEKRAEMVRNIRNIFERATLSTQEVNTLRGIITSLVTGR